MTWRTRIRALFVTWPCRIIDGDAYVTNNVRHLEVRATGFLDETLKIEAPCRNKRWYDKEPSLLWPWTPAFIVALDLWVVTSRCESEQNFKWALKKQNYYKDFLYFSKMSSICMKLQYRFDLHNKQQNYIADDSGKCLTDADCGHGHCDPDYLHYCHRDRHECGCLRKHICTKISWTRIPSTRT